MLTHFPNTLYMLYYYVDSNKVEYTRNVYVILDLLGELGGV